MSTAVTDDVQAVIDEVQASTSEATGDRYAGAIRAFAEWFDGDPFAADQFDVRDYLQHLKSEGYAYKTASVHQSGLTKFFDVATDLADAGRLDVHTYDEPPTARMSINDVYAKGERGTKKSKELDGLEKRHALDRDDVDKLANNVPAPSVRNELITRLTYQTMMRRSEVAECRLSWLDREERTVTVPAEHSKNGEARQTYYMASLDPLISAWLDVDRKAYSTATDSDRLFIGAERGQLSKYMIGTIVHEAAENAGLQSVLYTDAGGRDWQSISVHTLRHSGAVRRWEENADLRTLQLLLGHGDISTTQRYLDVDPDDLGEKARRHW